MPKTTNYVSLLASIALCSALSAEPLQAAESSPDWKAAIAQDATGPIEIEPAAAEDVLDTASGDPDRATLSVSVVVNGNELAADSEFVRRVGHRLAEGAIRVVDDYPQQLRAMITTEQFRFESTYGREILAVAVVVDVFVVKEALVFYGDEPLREDVALPASVTFGSQLVEKPNADRATSATLGLAGSAIDIAIPYMLEKFDVLISPGALDAGASIGAWEATRPRMLDALGRPSLPFGANPVLPLYATDVDVVFPDFMKQSGLLNAPSPVSTFARAVDMHLKNARMHAGRIRTPLLERGTTISDHLALPTVTSIVRNVVLDPGPNYENAIRTASASIGVDRPACLIVDQQGELKWVRGLTYWNTQLTTYDIRPNGRANLLDLASESIDRFFKAASANDRRHPDPTPLPLNRGMLASHGLTWEHPGGWLRDSGKSNEDKVSYGRWIRPTNHMTWEALGYLSVASGSDEQIEQKLVKFLTPRDVRDARGRRTLGPEYANLDAVPNLEDREFADGTLYLRQDARQEGRLTSVWFGNKRVRMPRRALMFCF